MSSLKMLMENQTSEYNSIHLRNVEIEKNVKTDHQSTPIKSINGKDALLEPYNYLRPNTGKDMKMVLLSAFDHWIKTPKEYMEIISRLTEAAHRAGLLIDDIQDNTEMRRGAPAAHRIYGIPLTISSSYYASFLMLSELTNLDKPEMVKICVEEVTNLQYGQGMDIFYRESSLCPTEEEYFHMVDCKTGALLRLAIRLMQEASDSKVDYTSLVDKMGRYFQIRDDYQNLCSKEYTDNQGFCADITEGKISFLIIHSVRSNESDRKLIEILKKRTKDIELKKFAIKLLEKTNTFDYCRQTLEDLEKEIRADIKFFGGNAKLERVIDAISIKREAIYLD